MSNVIWTEIQEMHDPIPNSDEDRIERFILRAETMVKSKLSPYVEMWTDATEPDIVKNMIQDLACWMELRALYGSQTKEFHDWIAQFREDAMELLHEIIAMLEEGFNPHGFTLLQSNQVRSNTKTLEKIFNLNTWESQSLHPEDADIRYGEN